MAEITPITREEFYLAKAGGQDVPVPSAVTREEYYLEKLTNDNVAVPTPVTRREKFLYFACGGEIDLPSEEKMTRLERLIAKAGGMDISTPTAITRLEKFWANVEGGGWKTITGVLPLTFTAKGGTAVDWVIEGNDENGTENLMQIIATSKTQNGIIFTVDGDGRITINGTATGAAVIYLDWVWGGNAVNAVEPNTTYTVTGGLNTTGVTFYWGTFNSDSTITEMAAIATTATVTTSAKAEKSRAFIYITEGAVCDNLVCEPMLVKGSTAPDHYIPYQQGVGERTVNLANVSDQQIEYTRVYYKDVFLAGSIEAGTYTLVYNVETEVEPFRLSIGVGTTGYNRDIAFAENQTSGRIVKTFTVSADYEGLNLYFRPVRYNQIETLTVTLSNVMLVEGSSVPSTYVPYGYQIPLAVKQQGQPDKTVDIYIGDSPLTEGETVSKTSTGVDIELFEGENTVSTTLYNKPTMEIKYK